MSEHFASIEKPWMKHYDAVAKGAQFPRCTMYREIQIRCEHNNRYDANALHYFGTEITYRNMFKMIDQYAAAFHELGIKKGEIVSVISVCLPEMMCEIYALNKLGAVLNFIDPRTDKNSAIKFIKKARSRVVITLEMCYKHIADELDALGIDLVICHNPADSLSKLKGFLYSLKNPKYDIPYDGKRILRNAEVYKLGEGKSVDEVEYEPDMPAVVVRTGGTTGLSKGVVLTNDNMNACAANFAVKIPVTRPGPNSDQTFLNILPVATSYGIGVGVHMAMSMNIMDYLIPKFEVAKFDELVLKYKPRHIIGVPVFYEKLIYSPKLKGKDLSFIATMAAGGDSASESLEDKLDEFRTEHGIEYPVAQGYGMSEVSSAAAFGFKNVHRKGSAGIPCFFNTIAAFEPGTTKELPIGQVGELCIAGPTVMKEYLDEPEETANAVWVHPDGQRWVHSGDLGYIDEDGFLFVVGRMKRTIVRADGHKVHPLQIEKVAMTHPAVANCAVIPVRDYEFSQGDMPLACIELGHSQEAAQDICKDVLEICHNNLNLRDCPVKVVCVDKVPVTDMLKNDYRKLIEQFKDYDFRKDN